MVQRGNWSSKSQAWILSYVPAASGSTLGSPCLTYGPTGQDKQEASIFRPSSLYGKQQPRDAPRRAGSTFQTSKYPISEGNGRKWGCPNPHKTTRGVKAPSAQRPCHFYPMQLLTWGNQAQILAGERDFRRVWGEDPSLSPRQHARQAPISHAQFGSVLLFMSNWQREKTQAAPDKHSTRVPTIDCASGAWLRPQKQWGPRSRLKSTRTTDYHVRLFLAFCFSESKRLNALYLSQETRVLVVKSHSQHSPVFTPGFQGSILLTKIQDVIKRKL